MLVFGFDCWVEKPYYRRKTPLVVGEIRIQVLGDSITIAASELNRCTYSFISFILFEFITFWFLVTNVLSKSESLIKMIVQLSSEVELISDTNQDSIYHSYKHPDSTCPQN